MSITAFNNAQAISREYGITINKDKIILIEGLPYIDYLGVATIRVYIFLDANGSEQFWFDVVEAATASKFKSPQAAMRDHCPNAVYFRDLQNCADSAQFKIRANRRFIPIGDLHRLFTNSPEPELREGANDLFFGKGAIAEQLANNGVAIDNGASAEQLYYAIENKIIDYCKSGTKPGKQMQLLFKTKQTHQLLESVEFINTGMNGHTNKEWALNTLHDNFEVFREEYRTLPKKQFNASNLMALFQIGEAIETKLRTFLGRSRGQRGAGSQAAPKKGVSK